MLRKTLFIAVLSLTLILPLTASATRLKDLVVTQNGDDIYVSVKLELSPELEKELKSGIEKKLIFYVDLFRAWYKWPDEFVLGKKIERELKCDNVKSEFTVTTQEWSKGPVIKRFENCDELLVWALSMDSVRLVNVKEIPKGRYLVKVSAESRLRNLPPLIGQLFFFVKDVEFNVRTHSEKMKFGEGK